MPGVCTLQSTVNDGNFILSVCLIKIGVNFESAGALPVLFTMMSAMPRTMPSIY